MFTFKPWKVIVPFAVLAVIGFTASYFFSQKIEEAKQWGPWKQVTAPLGASFQTADAVALFETSLTSSITSSATSFTLNSGTYNNAATTLASSTYGMIIDEGTVTEEIVLADCTGTACINAVRGLDRRTGTTTLAALQFAHRRGASVKITDAPSLLFAVNVFKGRQNLENVLKYNSQVALPDASSTSTQIPYVSWVANNFVDKNNTQTVAGAKTFSNLVIFSLVPSSPSGPTTGNDLANKTYVDGVAIAGAADASYTTKGIVERAAISEINTGAAAGNTSAPLFVSPSDLSQSIFASTTASTTNYAAAASFSTTTTMSAGQTAIVMASFDLVESTVGLYVKPAHNATTTLQASAACLVNGTSGETCPAAIISSYTSTTTDTYQFYIGTNINSIMTVPDGGNFTVLKFATSTFAK